MTNAEKYRTPKEQSNAFWEQYIGMCPPFDATIQFAKWLNLEYEQEERTCGMCEYLCEEGGCIYSHGSAIIVDAEHDAEYCDMFTRKDEPAVTNNLVGTFRLSDADIFMNIRLRNDLTEDTEKRLSEIIQRHVKSSAEDVFNALQVSAKGDNAQ